MIFYVLARLFVFSSVGVLRGVYVFALHAPQAALFLALLRFW